MKANFPNCHARCFLRCRQMLPARVILAHSFPQRLLEKDHELILTSAGTIEEDLERRHCGEDPATRCYAHRATLYRRKLDL